MQIPVPDLETVHARIAEISAEFAQRRADRQRRRELDRADFDRLRDAGYLLMAVPVEYGGLWAGLTKTTRPLAEMVRTLAHGDSSVALVSTMHPAVTSGWLNSEDAPEPYTTAWQQQREWVFQTSLDGHWWGTVISEPGSGGDSSKSKAGARRNGSGDGRFLLSGRKHFGSGSGITSFMITTAVTEGQTEPTRFVLDMRNVDWNGSTGVRLVAPWDGHGMTATQSHSFEFNDFPAIQSAWPEGHAAGGMGGVLFSAVTVGIIETAVDEARKQLSARRDSLRPFQQVEWSRVEIESWLIQQAYEGILKAADEGTDAARVGLIGKEAIAGLAESLMLRITKVIGGSSYSRNMPFGFWLEDVRALGFLRPPWALAYDNVFEGSL